MTVSSNQRIKIYDKYIILIQHRIPLYLRHIYIRNCEYKVVVFLSETGPVNFGINF